MARADAISVLYTKNKSPLEFQWDSLCGPAVYQLIPPADVEELRKIATSLKLNGDIVKKKEMINSIMAKNGFMRFHAGTNRVVYTHYEIPYIVCKVAVDRVGMNDNPREFKNQFELKPFVTKCFDISPCGTVGIFERVEPINSIEEFAFVYEDTFELITKCIVGKYVLEDIGSRFFNNYGIRKGFGICLLDYPYMYKLDGRKLMCNRPIFPNTKEPVCGGEIDYDDGFNYLVCRCCGKRYSAKDLEDKRNEGLILIKGGTDMLDVVVKANGKEIRPNRVSNTIKKPAPKAKEEFRSKKIEVVAKVNGKTVGDSKTSTIYSEKAPEAKINVSEATKEKKPERGTNGRFVKSTSAAAPIRGTVASTKPSTAPKKEESVPEEPSKEDMMIETPVETEQEEVVETVETTPEVEVAEPMEYDDPYDEYYQKAVNGKGSKKGKGKSKNSSSEKIPKRKASLSDY